MSKHLEKIHIFHLCLDQHDSWCDKNYVWCDPNTVSRPAHWAVWHGGLGRPRSASVVCSPPHVEKNKLFLNEYLGIFKHFRAYFFIFLNL